MLRTVSKSVEETVNRKVPRYGATNRIALSGELDFGAHEGAGYVSSFKELSPVTMRPCKVKSAQRTSVVDGVEVGVDVGEDVGEVDGLVVGDVDADVLGLVEGVGVVLSVVDALVEGEVEGEVLCVEDCVVLVGTPGKHKFSEQTPGSEIQVSTAQKGYASLTLTTVRCYINPRGQLNPCKTSETTQNNIIVTITVNI